MRYKDLEAWKKAMALVKEVYEITRSYPKEEQFCLTQQTRRAAISVPANIAEGIGRNYKKDTIQFLHISRGSLYELETLLSVAQMVNILQYTIFEKVEGTVSECQKIINGLIGYYERTDLK